MSKIIEAVLPFNNFFFKSCFFNEFFSIMEYYRINLLNILGFTDGYYRLSENGQLEFEYIDDIESSYSKEMLINLAGMAGMTVKINEEEASLLFIEDEIDRLHPVISIIDCYYLPYRTDTYKRKHSIHPILIKGYDEREEVYYIIDQVNDESLTYSNYTISYNDFKQGTNALSIHENDDYFNYLSSYSYNKNISLSLPEIKKEVIGIKKAHLQKFHQGKYAIQKYIEVFTVNDIIDNMDSVIIQLNSIVNFKLIEKHKIELLFLPPDDEELTKLIENILSCWKIFRRDLYMFYYSKKTSALALYDTLVDLLDRIYLYEDKYCELFQQI